MESILMATTAMIIQQSKRKLLIKNAIETKLILRIVVVVPYIRWACIAWWCRCDPQVECPGAEPLNSEVTSTTGPGESGVSKGQLHHLIRRTAEHLPSVNQGTRIAQAHAGPRNTTISLIPYVWRTTMRFIDTVIFPLLEVKLYREYSNAATIFGNAWTHGNWVQIYWSKH